MKRKILFAVLFLFMMIGVVNAEQRNKIEYVWKSYQDRASYPFIYYDDVIEVEDGFIATYLNEDEWSVLRKTDKNGQEIWKNQSEVGIIYGIVENNGEVYGLVVDKQGNVCVTKYTKDGKESEKSEDWLRIGGSNIDYYDGEIYIENGYIYVLSRGYFSDNSYGPMYFYKIELDLSDYERSNYSDSLDEFDELTNGGESFVSDKYDYLLDVEFQYYSNMKVINGTKYLAGEIYKDYQYYGVIVALDKNDNVIWYKESAKADSHYFDLARVSGNNIAVIEYVDQAYIGQERNSATVKTTMVVYDEDGNIIEEHDLDIDTGLKNVDVMSMYSVNGGLVLEAYSYDNGELKSHLIKYQVIYDITTKVNGKGNIEAVQSANAGSSVTFKITPEEGYVLGSVKVTDSAGNVLIFTDNTFTMPSADVTIEAEFVKTNNITNIINPNTRTSLSIIILILFVLGGFITLKSNKKLKELK